MKNAGQDFQRLMDTILEGIRHTFVYIDDILVASSSPEEYHADLTRVFDVLKENGLVVNRSKCVLGVPAFDFLGYRVDAKGARPLEKRVTAIRQFASPTTVKEFQRFLGMINFYRRFIPRAAHHLAGLFGALKNKPKTLLWEAAQRASFVAINNAISNAVLLHHPRLGAPLAITTDASDIAVGSVLEQLGPNGLLFKEAGGKTAEMARL